MFYTLIAVDEECYIGYEDALDSTRGRFRVASLMQYSSSFDVWQEKKVEWIKEDAMRDLVDTRHFRISCGKTDDFLPNQRLWWQEGKKQEWKRDLEGQ